MFKIKKHAFMVRRESNMSKGWINNWWECAKNKYIMDLSNNEFDMFINKTLSRPSQLHPPPPPQSQISTNLKFRLPSEQELVNAIYKLKNDVSSQQCLYYIAIIVHLLKYSFRRDLHTQLLYQISHLFTLTLQCYHLIMNIILHVSNRLHFLYT